MAREQWAPAGITGGQATELLGVRMGREVLPSLLATYLRDLKHPDGPEMAQLTKEKPRLRSVGTCPKSHASDKARFGLLASHRVLNPHVDHRDLSSGLKRNQCGPRVTCGQPLYN